MNGFYVCPTCRGTSNEGGRCRICGVTMTSADFRRALPTLREALVALKSLKTKAVKRVYRVQVQRKTVNAPDATATLRVVTELGPKHGPKLVMRLQGIWDYVSVAFGYEDENGHVVIWSSDVSDWYRSSAKAQKAANDLLASFDGDEAPRPHWLWSRLPHEWNEALCQKFGHKLVGRGYGNAETGCDDQECERCGEYWSVPLY